VELSYRHLRLVPRQYHRSSGLANAQLHIEDSSHFPYRFLRHPKGGAVAIQPSAFCVIREEGRPAGFLVYLSSHPTLAEAIMRMSESLFTGNRAQRYVTLFKAYECLSPAPDAMLSSVRHGLSHASTALSRPATVNALKLLFGTTRIDLDLAPHRRIFYRQLVALLVATDQLVASEVLRNRASLRQLRLGEEPLTEWHITGMPGIVDPIPVREEDEEAI